MSAATKSSPARSGAELKAWLAEHAKAEGFEAFGVAAPDARPDLPRKLAQALADGHHASMGWMAETAARRADPRVLWPQARSLVMLGLNYGPDHDPLAALTRREEGVISVYAQGDDYHDVIKGKLKRLAQAFAHHAKADVKVFVDTAPLMEKPWAETAGLGWQGKHTNLVSRAWGSWLFLGAILTSAELPQDAREADHCGSCRSCLDICPTAAFPAPYRLDAGRCLSYLTIEHKGVIAAEFRKAMGNRIYGCDDCLAVCPWNKFAQIGHDNRLAARDGLVGAKLAALASLDDAAFRALFSKSPVKRIGRDRFLRNVLIAIGNSGDASLVPVARARLDDAAPLVRGMAVWALSQLHTLRDFAALAAERRADEIDASVIAEWDAAMANPPPATGVPV
jgi:epoxyqueuosine reductase